MNDPRLLLSRRALGKGVAALSGAALGHRLAGHGFLADAHAAEPAHLVHIYFPGGYNALFGGCADKFVGGNVFDVTSTNVADLGGGVVTDASTLGTLPDFAKQHFAGVGFRHNVTAHNTPQNINGAERAILGGDGNNYLTKLAAALGGSSTLKCVHFGDRLPAGRYAAVGDVSIQRITDLGSALDAVQGKAAEAASRGPDRALAAEGLSLAQTLSTPRFERDPRSSEPLRQAYDAAVTTLRKPVPPQPPLTFDAINTAYGLGGAKAVRGFASMMAGAEIMIRAAASNVVSIVDPGFLLWDFHQMAGARSLNGQYSRSKMRREVLAPLTTFCTRMLNAPDRNVVVVLSGDFVRTPSGDHGDGTVATVMGKYVRNKVSFGVNARAQLPQGTPGMRGFWAAVASALKVTGSPFGDDPHGIVA